jgi:hypothetical protein
MQSAKGVVMSFFGAVAALITGRSEEDEECVADLENVLRARAVIKAAVQCPPHPYTKEEIEAMLQDANELVEHLRDKVQHSKAAKKQE